MEVAIQKLDSLGYIKGCCSLLIDPKRMNRVRHHLELADPIAEMKRTEDAASAEKKDEHATKRIELVPKAETF